LSALPVLEKTISSWYIISKLSWMMPAFNSELQ
jgi:hypothetical protein